MFLRCSEELQSENPRCCWRKRRRHRERGGGIFVISVKFGRPPLQQPRPRFTRRNFYQIRVAVISSRYPVIIIGVPLILDSTKEFTVVSLVSRRNRLIWPTSNDSSGIIKKWRRFQKIVVASAAPFQGEYLRLTPNSEFWSPHCSVFSNAFHDWIILYWNIYLPFCLSSPLHS